MFNRSLWRLQVGKRLDIFARNPQQDLQLSGTQSLLAHLTACTLHPFLNEYERQPIAAIQTLADMANGEGANRLVNQARKLRYQAGRILQRDLQSSSELRADIENIMMGIDTIHLVRQRLHSSRADWFCSTLSSELNTYPVHEFAQIRRRLNDNWKSFYDIFRELRQRRGQYTHEDLILMYVGLNDSSSGVRAEAARRLGEYSLLPPDKLVGKLIQVCLYDQDLETRTAAARALGTLRERIITPQLIQSLSRYLACEDRFVRSSAAMLVAELGELAAQEHLIEQLTGLLNDPDFYVREAAAYALGRMGPAAVRQDVMQALTTALRDPHEDVHGTALESLQNLRELRASMRTTRTVPAEKPRIEPQPEPARNGALSDSVLPFLEVGR